MTLDGRMEAVGTNEPVVSDSDKTQKIYIERFDILKFYRIDTIDGQSFSCQFFLRLLLPGRANLADLVKDELDDNDLSAQFYIDKIEPQNVSGDGRFEKLGDAWYKSEDGKDLLIKMRIQGTFFLDCNLKEFPFDTQNIMIRMIYTVTTAERTLAKRAEFIYDEDQCKSSKLIVKGYMNPKHSWAPIGEQDDKGNTQLEINAGTYEAADRAFPSFEASFKVLRKSGWHYNFFVAFPVSIIAGLSLVVFFFEHTEDDGYSDRRTISLALMIAASTYRQVVTAQVPNIDYTTNLDIYIFSNFVLLSFVTLVNCLFHLIDDGNEKRINVNNVLCSISFLYWLCIQIWWFGTAGILRKNSKKKTVQMVTNDNLNVEMVGIRNADFL